MMKSEFVIEQRKLEDNQSVEFGKRRRIQEAAGLLMNPTLIGDSVEGVAGLVKRASVRIWGVVDGLALVSKIDGLENIRLIILFFLKVPHRFRTRSTPAVAASTSRGFPGKMTLLAMACCAEEDTSDGGGAEEQKEARVERVSTGAGGQGKEEEDGGRKFNNVIIVVKNGYYGDFLRILSLNVILKFFFYESLTFSDYF